ncbi:cadherin, EGF LAG seven-pass G-type receptor, partial [Phytophthora pseudosyringae]
QALLSSYPAMFTGWISRFHFFTGAISLAQIEELTSYSVPSFFVVANSRVDPVTQDEGNKYCSGRSLRLCDLVDFESLCVDPHYSPAILPSASQGPMLVPGCSNSATKAEQNAGNAQIACCSQYYDAKLIGELARPIIKADALTASSFLNNSIYHGYGYGGLSALRSDTVNAAWCPESASSSEWVQISFPKATVVSRVQVYPAIDVNGNVGYLKTFQVAWRRSRTEEFSTLTDSSDVPINFVALTSNLGNSTKVNVVFPNLVAKDVRIIPTGWIGSTCLRLELFGPDSDFPVPGPLLATDGDTNQHVRYHLRESDRPSGVQIDPQSGLLSVRRRWIDFELQQSLRVTAEVYDDLGLSDTVTATIDVIDVNDAPSSGAITYGIAENPTEGSLIGKFEAESVEATEKLAAQILDAGCPFRIDRLSNKLVVHNATKFDFEINAVIRCVLLVTDDAPYPRSIYTTVFIQLADVNEVPAISTGQRGFIREHASQGELVMAIEAMDPDKNPAWSTLRFGLLNTSIFAVNSLTGAVSMLSPGVLDFETSSELTLQVQVTDGGFLSAQATVFVSVLNEEETPLVAAFYKVIVPENGVVPRSLLLVNATDPDRISQDQLSFSLVENVKEFAIDGRTGELILLKPLDYESVHSINLTVNVAKRGTTLNVNSTVYILLSDVNEPPELYAGTRIGTSVEENMVEGLPVGASLSSYIWDPENNTLSYVLEASEYSPFFTLDGCAGQLRSKQPLDFETMPREVRLTVSVIDSNKARLRFSVSVAVHDVNEPPVFAQTQYVLTVEENTVSETVVGVVSASDPDLDNESHYIIKSAVDSSTFKIDPARGEISVSATAVLDYETRSSYTLQVCATDNLLETCTIVFINVLDVNEPPSCRSETRYVVENSPTGATVTPPFESIDVDVKDLGFYPVFSLIDTEAIGVFRFDNASIVVQSLSVDYEARDMYRFQFAACDAAGACSTCKLTIYVTDTNEHPVVSNQIVQVPEGTNAAFCTVQAYDPDLNQTSTLLYELLDQSLAGVFSVEPGSGIVTVIEPERLDFETVPLHQAWVNVRVTDRGVPPLAATGHLIIHILDINEAPTSAGIIDVRVPENAAVGTLVLTWIVQDEDFGQQLTYQVVNNEYMEILSFRDTGSPVVILEASLNYETMTEFQIELQACDPYVMCTSTLLRIAVENSNEPPYFLPYLEFTVASHATLGTVIGVLQAMDPDYGDVLSFSILSSENTLTASAKDGVSVFSVNPQTGELKVASPRSIEQLQIGYNFTLTAKVTDLKQMSATTRITVGVVPNNTPPICQKGLSVYMDENTAVSTLVGLPLASVVTDADTGTTFAFALQHPFLSVNPSTGQLFVTCETNLDFESSTLSTTTASVVVTDDGAYHDGLGTLSTSCIVFITARDVNEIPKTTNLSLRISEGSNSNPSHMLPTEMFTFPIRSSQQDYTVTKKISGGYAVNASRKTLPLGYDSFSQTSLGVVLNFEGVQFPEVIDHISLAQLRFTVPSGKIGPFSLQIRVIAEPSISWSSNQALERFGMPAFVQWTVEKEVATTTIWSPSIVSILEAVIPYVSTTTSIMFLITGGGIGEVSAFDRGAATSAVLEVAVAQVSRVSLDGGMVQFSDPDAGDNIQFAITKGNPHNPVFFVDKGTGEITTNIDLLDYEVQNAYELSISVTDKLGLATVSTVNIDIVDVNEPPVVNERICYVAENEPVGTRVCVITASDPDTSALATGTLLYYLAQTTDIQDATFQIDSNSGMLFVANSTLLNYEVRQQFVVTVCAKDGGNPSLSGCGVVTVYTTDTDDAPTMIWPPMCEMDEYSYDFNNQQMSQLVGAVVCNLTVLDEDYSGSVNAPWNNHVWKIMQADEGCPFNVSSQGQVVVNNPRRVNYEDQKKWSLMVQAMDLGGLFSPPQIIDIIIRNINEKPQMVTTTFYIDENSRAGTQAMGNLTIFDPDIRNDGQHDTVIVSLIGQIDTFNVVNNKVELVHDGLDFETKSSYVISVVAIDESGAKSNIQHINIGVNDVNETPTIDPMQVSILENQPATTKVLPAVKASDPDGDSVHFSLVSETPKGAGQRAPTAFGIDAMTGVLFQQVDNLDFEQTDEYALVVKARDSTGLFSTAIVTVTISDVNEAPSILGQTVSIREDAIVGTLVGQAWTTISSDPDLKNGYETLNYALQSSNETTFSMDSKSGQITTSGRLDFETKSVYNLRVRVVDYKGLLDEVDFAVTIIDVNEPPTVGEFNISVSENLIPGSAIGDPIVGIDPDVGSKLEYDIVGTSDRVTACIRINTSTGQIFLKVDCSLDYESSSGTTMSVVVRVSDGEFTATTKGTVYINDVNESPVLVASVPTLFNENSPDETVVTLVLVQDPDINDYHKFWICEQSNPTTFRIQPTGLNTAELIVQNSTMLNFEKTPSLWVDACVQDKGNLTSRARYSIQLVNVFEPPYFVQEIIQFTVAESILGGSNIGLPLSRLVVDEENLNAVIGCSVDMNIINSTCSHSVSLSLDSCGQITLATGNFDYETMSTCVVYIMLPVTGLYNANTSSSPLANTVAVVLTVTDVNEPPTFSQELYQFGVAEVTTKGALVGVVTGTDADAGAVLSFQLLRAEVGNEGTFMLSPSGALTLAGSLDFETKQSYQLSVRVLDEKGSYADASVIISVTDSNEPPVFKDAHYSFTVVENAPVQAVIGDVIAIDSDTYQNKTLTYSIVSGNDLSVFVILSIAGNGKIVVSTQQVLDYERQESYILLVAATDSGPGGLCSFTTVSVDIIDVNEAPLVYSRTLYIPEDAVITTAVCTSPALNETFTGKLFASDADGKDKLVFTIADTTDTFAIDPISGAVLSKRLLNFERKSTYSIYITATDSGNLSAASMLDIIILDRNDAPIITSTAFPLAENPARSTLVGFVRITDEDYNQQHVFVFVEATLVMMDNSIDTSSGNNAVSIGATSGSIQVVNESCFDYEVVRQVIVVVTVSDDGNPIRQATGSLTLELTNENEECAFVQSMFIFSISENMVGVAGQALAVDPDTDMSLPWGSLSYYIIDSEMPSDALSISNTGEVLLKAALDFETQHMVSFQVAAVDGGGLFCSAIVQLLVENINEPPVIQSNHFWVPESVDGNLDWVRADDKSPARISIWDPENDSITVSQKSSDYFVISNEGLVSLKTPVDFEVKPYYDLLVTAVDVYGLQSSSIVRVDVLDLNEPPAFTPQPTMTIAEDISRGAVVGVVGAAYDPDEYDVISYQLVAAIDRDGKSVDIFMIHSCDGEIRMSKPNALDYETNDLFILTVSATDRAGLQAFSGPITVVISDVNEPPVCRDGILAISENAAAGDHFGPIEWSDPDSPNKNNITVFEAISDIDEVGYGIFEVRQIADQYWLVLQYSGGMNYESVNSFTVHIRIGDSFVSRDEATGTAIVSSLSTTCSITIHVLDVNEPPIVASTSKREIAENSPLFTPVGLPIEASDPDAQDILHFSILSGQENVPFTIDYNTGQIRVSGDLDYETQLVYTFDVAVEDTAFNLILTLVEIYVLDINERPELPRNCIVREDGSTEHRYEDNQHVCVEAREDREVGSVLRRFDALDPDINQRLFYSVGETSDPFVRVVQNDDRSCELVYSRAIFDYEHAHMHRVQLTVTDTGKLFLYDTVMVFIFVLDVNEPPVLLQASTFNLAIVENFASGQLLGQLTGTDPEGDEFIFSLTDSRPIPNAVDIGEDGQLFTTGVSLDYEALANMNSVWTEPMLTIRGSIITFDAVSTPFNFTVSVIDAPEPPSFGAEKYDFAVQELASAGSIVGVLQAIDPDLNDIHQFKWDKTDADTSIASNVFWIDAKSGTISLLQKGVLDAESASTYRLKALVTDSTALVGSTTVVISIVSDNEPPICPLVQCWAVENSVVLLKGLPGTQGFCQVVVQDLDIGQKHTFQLLSTADSRTFFIDYGTGVVRFALDQQSYANFEVQSVYRLRYQSNDIPDAGLSLACSNDIVITVVDVNEVPTIPGRLSLAVAEMSALGTVVGTIDAIDEDIGDMLKFTLETSAYSPFTLEAETGVLTVANASMINFEVSPSMAIDVVVTDREGLRATATLHVAVINVNDPPVLVAANFTANEFALSKVSGSFGVRSLELLGSIHCFDEDIGDEMSFALLNETAAFVIESKSGLLYAETRYIDFEITRAYDLTIQCSDGQAAAVSTVWVFVTNVNEAPIITGQVYRINENSPDGTSLGLITVSDPERNDDNFLAIVGSASRTANVVSRLQDKTPVFSDTSDFEWMNIPDNLVRAFVIATPASAPLSSASLNLASSGDLFVLVEEDSDDTPDWLSQNGFVKMAGQLVTAQSSTSATSYAIFIREKSDGTFIVPDTTASSMLCIFGAYPSPLKYFIHGSKRDWFDVTSSGELLLATATLDYEAISASDQPLQIVVSAVDSEGLMGEATLSVFIDDVNETPIINSCCFEIEENPAVGTMIGVLTASDQDASDQIFFDLAFPSTDISVTPSGSLSVRNSSLFDFERNYLVTVRVRATDQGGLISEREIQISVLDVNEPPVFQQSSYSFSVPENSASGLPFGTPIRAVDPDRGQTESLRYELVNKNTGGLPFRLESCSGQLAVQWDKLDYEGTNHYSFGVRVIDSGYPVALEAQVQVVIDIRDVNEAPKFAEYGVLFILESAPSGTFIGQIVATDPDQASVLSFRTNASDYVSITNRGRLYSVLPFDYETMPSLYVSITTEDNGVSCDPMLDTSDCESISVSTNVVVLVRNVNEPPSLAAENFAIQENLSPGSLVGKPIQVVDVDGTVGNSSGFSIVNGLSSGNASEFTVRSDGQLLTLVTMDFETKAQYKLKVAYSDGEFLSHLNITVSVQDENEPPSVIRGISGSVQENMAAGTTVLSVQFTDPDHSSTNAFTLVDRYAPFKIDPYTGILQTTRSLDYEKDPTVFNLNVRVCDTVQTTVCGTGYVTINVTDVPEAPSMDAVTCSVVENLATVLTEQGTAACTVIATDPDKASCSFYAIVDTNSNFELVHDTVVGGLAKIEVLKPAFCTAGRVGFAWKASSLPDYEVQSQYVVSIRVSDETVGTTGLFVDSQVTVNVINANDCPTLAPLSFTVRERSPAGMQIGYPLPGKDQDVSDTLAYAIVLTNDTSGLIGIDRMTGQLTVARSPSDSELVYPVQYNVIISVTDSSTQRCSTSATMKISTTKSNFAPVWLNTLPASFGINENSGTGTQAGVLLSSFARDPDNDVIQFTMQSKTDSNCAETFSLGLTNGAIKLREGSTLDYEKRRTYICTVAACDSAQMCSTQDVTVQVKNINEEPTFSDQLYTFVVKENEATKFELPRCISATDPDEGDGYALTYAMSCANFTDCSLFSLKLEKDCSQALCARIIVQPSMNYEARRRYSFNLQAKDPGQLTAVTTIVIEVEDVNEVHSFVNFLTTKSVQENTAIDSVVLQVSTKDPDIYSDSFKMIQYTLVAVSPPGLDIFRIDATTGDLIVSGVIDFEAVQAFTLTIEARDSSGSDALVISNDLIITVLNAQDTTVDAYALVANGSRKLDTIGGEKFVLSGSNIGFKQRGDGSVVIKELLVQYGAYGTTSPYSATDCTLVNGNTGVECTTAPGVGANLYWNITLVMSVPKIGDTTFQATSSVPLTSYGSPVVNSVVCTVAFPTSGSTVENIFVYGENLGSVHLTSSDAQPAVLYGSEFEAQNCQLHASTGHNAPSPQYVACRSALGTGQNLPFTVVVRGQASATFSTSCHYASPVITAVAVSDGMQTLGSDAILVSGTGFGCRGCANITVRYTNDVHMFELDDCKVVVDHVQLACLSRPGAGGDFQWQVSVDSQHSVLTRKISTSYDLPEVREVMGFKDVLTAGGTVFQILGDNFGPDTAIFVDPVVEYSFDNVTALRAVNCKRKYTDPKNHNLIQCVSVAGSGSFHSWRVIIEGQTSLWTTQNTSYAGPIVNKVFRPGGETEIKTSGDQQVVITGKNFGTVSESVVTSVTYGVNGDEFAAKDCAIVIDHERITCTTAPGVGNRLAWIITIDGLTSATPTISYAKPYITSIEGEGAVNALVRGGQSLILRGGNFGPGGVAIDRISYGSSGRDYQVMEVVEHNDSTIVCMTVPGVGANLSWVVSVGDQESSLSTVTSSYAPPAVTSYYPTVALTDGSSQVTIIGENLGANVTFAASRVMFSPPQASLSSYRIPIVAFGDFGDSNSSEYVVVRIPVGYGSGALMQILVGTSSVQKSASLAISYGPPTVDSVYTDEGPSECLPSCIQLTVTGTNFYTTGRVLVSKYPITASNLETASYESSVEFSSWSHYTITILKYIGRLGYVTVVIGREKLLSNSAAFSWDDPSILDWNTYLPAFSIGETFSCTIESVDHELIKCTTSEGQGSGHEVVVLVSEQSNVDRTHIFSYDPPVIYSISRSDGPTSGYTCSCIDPDQPCATLEAPVECRYLEASSTSTSLDSYCVQTVLSGDSQSVTFTAVEDVYSSNKPVYTSDEGLDVQLLYMGGSWRLLQNDESIYRASTSTVSPPPTGWLDVTVDPPVSLATMKVYPGSCSKAASRACPSGTELCERVAITLAGKNFGVQSLDWHLELLKRDGSMETVSVNDDDIVYFSHSNIKFNLPPGQGGSRVVNLTVSELQLVNTSIEFGYQTPELIGYETSTSNLSTCGGYTMTLYGKNFGSTRSKVLIGGRDARVDGQSSHVRACGSNTCEYSTSGPCIDTDTLVCYPSFYVVSPTFSFLELCDDPKGTQMMCEAADPAPELSEDFTSHSDFVIVTTVPTGYGADVEVYVIVDDQPSNALTFSYNQPVVTTQMPNQPDANGANAITIKGTDFGCFPNDAISISFVSTDTVQSISRKLSTSSIPELRTISSIFEDESDRRLDDTTTSSSSANSSENSTGTVVWTSASELVWYPPKTKAGITSIILSVGGNVMSSTSQTQLKFQCSPGYYRTSTEFCDECPEGATCAGGDEMPLAKPGYWREGEVVLACDPMYACLGANKCAVGYTDIRCGECETNYHKLNSECNLCPANKWGSVAIVVICIGVASIVSYLLTRRGVSLGLLSIGIDYFQTLSIFGNARISWPTSLINLFATLSAFNLNLELIAPECFSFQVSYVKKWFIIELFPLVMAAISLGIFVALYVYKRFIKRRRTRLTSHLPQLFGSTLVMMYYLFLYLTRTTLDVFNCVGTIPSDGKLYMVAIYTQCFKPGGVHMQLFPFAVLAFVVYSLGYPLFVLLTLSRNRALVMEDQLLRAMQRGTSRRTNPNCWVFRKKFSKLYYQFKPGFWYWMVLIILRKFLLAGIGLLFRQDPVFQLATATFVLFVNYALQVRCRPYMSAYETQRVLADYAKRVLLETRRAKAKGETYIQPAHLRLEMHASTVTAWKSGHGDHGGTGAAGSSGPSTSGLRGANEAILASQEPQNLVGYLWDHNTVEACLLFSASLVLLAGVMFESGRLGSSEMGFTSASAQMLAIATTILVVVSCVYFALVLITELVVALRPDYYKRITRVQKIFSSPRRHLKDDADADQGAKQHQRLPAGVDESDDDDDDELEMVATMTQNPLHFNRALAGARGLAMRARERDALAALQDIQRRGSDRRRNSPPRQSTLGEEEIPSDDDAVPRRRRSQRRRVPSAANPESRRKRDENVMAELASTIEETDDLSQRHSTED